MEGYGDEEEHVILNDADYIGNEEDVANIIKVMFREQPAEYDEPPAPEDCINSLEATPAEEAGTACVICQEEITAGELVHILPGCRHIFHNNCIRDWLQTVSLCFNFCNS